MTRRNLALHLLERAGDHGVTTGEFLQAGVGSRYGARVKELRDEGYRIGSERLRDGAWRYTLLDGSAGVERSDRTRAGESAPSPAAPAPIASLSPGRLFYEENDSYRDEDTV